MLLMICSGDAPLLWREVRTEHVQIVITKDLIQGTSCFRVKLPTKSALSVFVGLDAIRTQENRTREPTVSRNTFEKLQLGRGAFTSLQREAANTLRAS